MGIDRIGKPAGPSGVGPTEAASVGPSAAAEAFSVGKVDTATQIDPSSPLEQLRAGNIDVNTYLDQRIDQATAHLRQRVDDEQLAFIRSALRAQLEQDPMLVELVKRATSVTKKTADAG